MTADLLPSADTPQSYDLSQEFLTMENRAFSDHVRELIESSQRNEGVQDTPLIIINVVWESLGEDNSQRLRKGRVLKAIQDGHARYPGLFRISVVMTNEELQRTRDMANVFGSGIKRIVEQK